MWTQFHNDGNMPMQYTASTASNQTVNDKVSMLIAIDAWDGEISCTGQRPPCRGLHFSATFTSVLLVRQCSPCVCADYTMTSSSALETPCFT